LQLPHDLPEWFLKHKTMKKELIPTRTKHPSHRHQGPREKTNARLSGPLSSRKGNDDEIIQRQRVRREGRRTAGRTEVQARGHERSAGTRISRTEACGEGFTRQAVDQGNEKENAPALKCSGACEAPGVLVWLTWLGSHRSAPAF
jgi:hypothetical protein